MLVRTHQPLAADRIGVARLGPSDDPVRVMSGGIEIECVKCDDGPSSYLVWLVSPPGHRILFHEAASHAEARDFAIAGVPIFGPILRDDGAEPIQ